MTATLDQQGLAARIFASEQRFCRVLEIPRHLDPDRSERAPDPTAAHLLAALVSAHTGSICTACAMKCSEYASVSGRG